MDPSILTRFQKFNLREEETEGVQLSSSDIQASTEECMKSLIGEIYRENVANYTGLKNSLSTLWTSIGPLKIRELWVNLYQFVFATHDNKIKILNGKTWTFDVQFLILKP